MTEKADNKPLISTAEMLTELNLDTTAENNEVVDGLIEDARALIKSSVNQNLNASAVNDDPIYCRAVKALVTALYYDRSLSQGLPLGVRIMIDHLKGRYAKWPDASQNGKR